MASGTRKRSSSKKRATAQDQDLIFKQAEVIVLDEIAIGTTKMRLVQQGEKTKMIQLWSSLSNQWNNTHRYEVEQNWLKWKKYANLHSERSKDGRSVGRDMQLGRTSADPKRTAGRKTRASSTKDNVVDRKPTKASTRRIQGSAQKNQKSVGKK
jgi:hypothetical protein